MKVNKNGPTFALKYGERQWKIGWHNGHAAAVQEVLEMIHEMRKGTVEGNEYLNFKTLKAKLEKM